MDHKEWAENFYLVDEQKDNRHQKDVYKVFGGISSSKSLNFSLFTPKIICYSFLIKNIFKLQDFTKKLHN
jgi:hypothetical protein